MTKTTIQAYFEARDALIAEDRAKRVDHGRYYSAAELSADQILRKIRAEEAVSVWGQGEEEISVYRPNDDTPGPNVFPGMEFLTGGCVPFLR